MTYEELTARLNSMADPTVGPYMHRIVSDTGYPMRCIRLPELRALAKEAAKGDWRRLSEECRFATDEEVLIIGLAIAYAKVPFGEKEDDLWRLLPRLDSWALTDSIVPTLRIRETERGRAWPFARECLESDLEYTIRFGIILLMRYYLAEDSVAQVAEMLTALRDERYYVRMAVAWCFAEMAVNHGPAVDGILQAGALDTFTHNMTIRKMRESYRISPEHKAAVAALKRKE